MMISLPLALLEWAARHRLWARPQLLLKTIPDEPEGRLDPALLYLEIRGGYPKWAYLLCPRCGEDIQIPAAKGEGSWTCSADFFRRPTLRPSVWQTGSCGAHFVVQRGLILWCAD